MTTAPASSTPPGTERLADAVDRAVDDAEARMAERQRFVTETWPELAGAVRDAFGAAAEAVRRRGHHATVDGGADELRVALAARAGDAPGDAPAALLIIEALPATQRIRVRWSVPGQVDDESVYSPSYPGHDFVAEAVRRWLPDALYWTSPVAR